MKKMLFNLIVILLAVNLTSPTKAVFDSAALNKEKPLKIQRITPQGEDVPAGRQIIFQFNQPVVPLGKMERDVKDIHIDIVPALDCQWRWLNTSALACELGDENTQIIANFRGGRSNKLDVLVLTWLYRHKKTSKFIRLHYV